MAFQPTGWASKGHLSFVVAFHLAPFAALRRRFSIIRRVLAVITHVPEINHFVVAPSRDHVDVCQVGDAGNRVGQEPWRSLCQVHLILLLLEGLLGGLIHGLFFVVVLHLWRLFFACLFVELLYFEVGVEEVSQIKREYVAIHSGCEKQVTALATDIAQALLRRRDV